MIGGVRSIEIAEHLLAPLREYGYVTPADCNTGLTERRWLMRHADGHRTHHLHLVVLGSIGWERTLRFRDALRSDPVTAQKYSDLKNGLSHESGQNRTRYAQAKSAFIEEVVQRSAKREKLWRR